MVSIGEVPLNIIPTELDTVDLVRNNRSCTNGTQKQLSLVVMQGEDAPAIDLSTILELPFSRLSGLLRERGCGEAILAKCETVEDLYKIAPPFLTLPVTSTPMHLIRALWLIIGDG